MVKNQVKICQAHQSSYITLTYNAKDFTRILLNIASIVESKKYILIASGQDIIIGKIVSCEYKYPSMLYSDIIADMCISEIIFIGKNERMFFHETANSKTTNSITLNNVGDGGEFHSSKYRV